jgi:hypothetical protein
MIVLLVGIAAIAGCLGEEEEGEDITITINGKERSVSELFDNYETETVTASNEETYEGIPLEDLLYDEGVLDINIWQYRITASDEYMKEVTHINIQDGILVEEDLMTVFPDLPGKYRIKDVVSIEPIEGDTITINGDLYTWMQPFDIFTATEMSNGTVTLEGVLLSDLLNSTEITDPQDHNFTIRASDYEQEVTWDDMVNGILVKEDMMTFFPHLEKKYYVKNVIEIEVV